MHARRLILVIALAAALLVPSSAEADRAHETPIVVRVDGRGFQWTDAAVGAVAGMGATLVIAGGVALLRLGRAASTHEKGARP